MVFEYEDEDENEDEGDETALHVRAHKCRKTCALFVLAPLGARHRWTISQRDPRSAMPSPPSPLPTATAIAIADATISNHRFYAGANWWLLTENGRRRLPRGHVGGNEFRKMRVSIFVKCERNSLAAQISMPIRVMFKTVGGAVASR